MWTIWYTDQQETVTHFFPLSHASEIYKCLLCKVSWVSVWTINMFMLKWCHLPLWILNSMFLPAAWRTCKSSPLLQISVNFEVYAPVVLHTSKAARTTDWFHNHTASTWFPLSEFPRLPWNSGSHQWSCAGNLKDMSLVCQQCPVSLELLCLCCRCTWGGADWDEIGWQVSDGRNQSLRV